ncbi:hypothetical protein BVY04_04800 [bacterium M21]|nr:hypothetical protein BVY04_04800 [bacterium M21]
MYRFIVLFIGLLTIIGQAKDLPSDPAVRTVTVENGLTCWVRNHKTPPGKVTMWLHVGSGSLNENQEQRGLAHFLEHMAFNGSENFAPGELVKYFESIGMQFGRHQNAFTSFDQTTYQLSLPNVEKETLEKGLLCLSDYAYRLSLLPVEIRREVGVVLEEMRARDGLRKRIQDQTIVEYLPGSRLVDRMPIGLKEVIEKADPSEVKGYYERWYRPDLCTLIVVGDIDLEQTMGLIKKQFAGWEKPAEPAREESTGIVSYDKQRGAMVTDPEFKSAEFTLATIRAGAKPDTEEEFRKGVISDLGDWILSRRLRDLIKQGKAPFQSASAVTSYMFNCAYFSGISAEGRPQDAQKILTLLTTEAHRARLHGFLAQELLQAKKATISSLERSVKTEPTYNSRSLAARLNSAAARKQIPMSAKQTLKLTKSMIHDITLDEVTAAFRTNYPTDKRMVLAILPENHKTGFTKENLLTTVQEVEKQKILPKEVTQEITGLLKQAPAPGKWVEQQEIKDLKLHAAKLENGISVHFRKMDYKKDQVVVRMVLSGGIINETAETRGLTNAAFLAFSQAATTKFSSKQISDLFSDKKVSVGASVSEDAVVITISGSPMDLEYGYQLVYALFQDAKLEAAALENWRKTYKLQYKQKQTVAEGRLFEELPKLTAPSDIRLHELTPEQADAITVDAAQAWLKKVLAEGMLEVAIVGDMKKDQAMALTATYLGSLPKRPDTTEALNALRTIAVGEGPFEKTIDVKSIANRSAVFVGWRSVGWSNKLDVLKLNVATMVLQRRIREEIREKRGLTYSASVFSSASSAFEGVSVLACYFTADPGKDAAALEIAKKVIQDFAKEGPTGEEMAIAQKQASTSVIQALKEPGFWARRLSEFHYHNVGYDYMREVAALYSSFTADQIKETLGKYVKEGRRIQIISRKAAAKAATKLPVAQ